MAHPIGTTAGEQGVIRRGRRLILAGLLLACAGCGRHESLVPVSAPSSGDTNTKINAPAVPSPVTAPAAPSHSTRAFGVFQVVHDSKPSPSWEWERWDRVQVLRDGQRLLQVTSDELGPNITVHDATGHDITGDGVPEIVLTSSSEGNHCCEDLVIYSITPTVHRLAHESSDYCADLVDVDEDGVPELVTCDVLPDMPAAEALQCSEAERPTPTVIYRFEAATGRYRLATPEYWTWRRDALMRAAIEAERRSSASPCALYAAALDLLYAGDRQRAERLLRRLQPADCISGADCGEHSAQWSTGLRTQLGDALRRSHRYLARSDAQARTLPR